MLLGFVTGDWVWLIRLLCPCCVCVCVCGGGGGWCIQFIAPQFPRIAKHPLARFLYIRDCTHCNNVFLVEYQAVMHHSQSGTRKLQ